MVNQQKFIKNLVRVVEDHKPTPEELRHAFKRVRAKTGLRTPTRPKKAPKSLKPPEIIALYKEATKQGVEKALLYQLLIETGLRVSEAQSVDIRDFDSENNTLQVREGKGSKDRAVPFTDRLWRQIRAYVQGRSSGPLFMNNRGKAYSVRTLQRWVKEVAKEVGIANKVTPHVLRHTFAYLMISKGMSHESLQPMMGHERIETTQIYSRSAIPLDTRHKYLRLMDGI